MAENRGPRALPGSEPPPLIDGSRTVPAKERDVQIVVTLIVRAEAGQERSRTLDALLEAVPMGRRHLDPESAKRLEGHREAAVAEVLRRAAAFGLNVVSTDVASGTVEVSAPWGELCNLLRVEPVVIGGPHGPVRSHRGPIHLPSELDGLVEAVLGLDEHPIAWPTARAAAGRVPSPVSALEVADRYDFPEGDGAGRTIAIIELGGGFHRDDLEAACRADGVAVPRIDVSPVGGADNDPADPDLIAATLALYRIGDPSVPPPDPPPDAASLMRALWTIETSLDLQVIAALAPAAHIRLYVAPNTSRGKVAALRAALDDECDVVSVSFGPGSGA
jgi:kumamolisin